ncbi:MAG: hypothetical protein WA709_06235 [Stellaceae bacterium]
MNETDRNRLTEIRARCARSDELGVLAGLPSFEGDFDFLLRLIDQHDQRVTELLEANNRELERRRAATGALRRLRQRITGAILDGAPRPIQIRSADQLVAAMRIPPPPSDSTKYPAGDIRDVYEGTDATGEGAGEYFVTYGGGTVARSAIDEAVRRGLIRLKYDCGGYWCLADA